LQIKLLRRRNETMGRGEFPNYPENKHDLLLSNPYLLSKSYLLPAHYGPSTSCISLNPPSEVPRLNFQTKYVVEILGKVLEETVIPWDEISRL
jgi:hypothetical protein